MSDVSAERCGKPNRPIVPECGGGVGSELLFFFLILVLLFCVCGSGGSSGGFGKY